MKSIHSQTTGPHDVLVTLYWFVLPVVIILGTVTIALKPKWMVFIPPKITVPILAHEVEPYHIITAAEIGKKVISTCLAFQTGQSFRQAPATEA